MRRFDLALTVFTVAGLAVSPAWAADKAEKDILAAMETWKQATMKKDRALLEKVYHPDLTYGHSNGQIESKAEAIEHVLKNAAVYEGIDLAEPKVQVHGKTALLTGKLDMRQRADDKVTVANLVYLTVWVKEGAGWQMIGRQATRPAAAAGAGAGAGAGVKKP